MAGEENIKTDQQKLIEVLVEIGVKHEIFTDKDSTFVTVCADASDKYVSIAFEHGTYSYAN